MYFINFVVFTFTVAIISTANGQQIVKSVVSSLDPVIRDTKITLGLDVDVIGHNGYATNGDGDKNLTFVLSGKELGNGVNPFVKLSFRSGGADGRDFVNFGMTESETGGTNGEADWNQAFWFIWKKGTQQKWHIRVYDHNHEDKLIGEGTLDVDQYVEGGQDSVVNLDGGIGKIIVKKTTPIKFKLSAKNLSRLDEFNTKSDPYVKVYFRRGETGPNIKFYTTSTIDNVVNADWDDVIEFPNYQKGTGQYLFFKVRDSDTITKDDHLGELLINVDEYVNGKGPLTIHLEHSGENSTLTIIPVGVDKVANS